MLFNNSVQSEAIMMNALDDRSEHAIIDIKPKDIDNNCVMNLKGNFVEQLSIISTKSDYLILEDLSAIKKHFMDRLYYYPHINASTEILYETLIKLFENKAVVYKYDLTTVLINHLSDNIIQPFTTLNKKSDKEAYKKLSKQDKEAFESYINQVSQLLIKDYIGFLNTCKFVNIISIADWSAEMDNYFVKVLHNFHQFKNDENKFTIGEDKLIKIYIANKYGDNSYMVNEYVDYTNLKISTTILHSLKSRLSDVSNEEIANFLTQNISTRNTRLEAMQQLYDNFKALSNTAHINTIEHLLSKGIKINMSDIIHNHIAIPNYK